MIPRRGTLSTILGLRTWVCGKWDAFCQCLRPEILTALSLHKEILDFYDFVRPHEYEEAVRRDLVARVERAIRSANLPSANTITVECFGSFAAGLYLPTADMDLVAVTPTYMRYDQRLFCQSKNHIFKLGNHLERIGIAAPGTMSCVIGAKVPIVKFTDKITGIKVDVSFENDSGIVANRTFHDWKVKYPAMPVIVVLIKQLLAMRSLNEVFTGGLGGFSIICLVVSMMQLMPELQTGNMDGTQHYSDLLLRFLDLYGNRFDIRKTGIIMDPPGYYDKEHEPKKNQNPNKLTIIDPNKSGNDISGGSRNIDDVLNCFRKAHHQIQQVLVKLHSGEDVEDSILGCMWAGNYTSFIHQRDKLSRLHRGYAVSPPPVSKHKQIPKKPPPPPKPQRQQLIGAPPGHPLAAPPGPPNKKGYVERRIDSNARDEPNILMQSSLPQKAVTTDSTETVRPGDQSAQPRPKTKIEHNKEEKLEKASRHRAVTLMNLFPSMQYVPESLTRKEFKKLKRHGFGDHA